MLYSETVTAESRLASARSASIPWSIRLAVTVAALAKSSDDELELLTLIGESTHDFPIAVHEHMLAQGLLRRQPGWPVDELGVELAADLHDFG